MINLDAEAIRGLLGKAAAARLSGFDTFPEIESTNTYLMHRMARRRVGCTLRPRPTRPWGVAVTDAPGSRRRDPVCASRSPTRLQNSPGTCQR